MKLKNLWKKAAAFVMAAVTALSMLPATQAFAATGDVGTISFTHTYDSAGNYMYYNSGAVINGYSAGGTGNVKYRMYVDGEVGFCLQPGVPLKTGDTLVESASEAWNALSSAQKKAVGLALLYGYQGNRGNLSGSDDEKWLASLIRRGLSALFAFSKQIKIGGRYMRMRRPKPKPNIAAAQIPRFKRNLKSGDFTMPCEK